MKIRTAVGAALIITSLTAAAIYVGAPAVVAQRAMPAPPPPPAEPFMLRPAGAHLGVTAKDLEPGEAERLKVKSGVLVESVLPESPAAAAGLQAGDIMVEFDGERVRSARQFARLVQESIPDRPLQATIVRNGERRQLALTPTRQKAGFPDSARIEQYLGNLPDRWPFNADPMLAGRSRLGATVDELTPQLADYFGAKDGVLVTAVTENSPARRAGLRAGDVIVSVEGQSIASASDLRRAISSAPTGTPLAIGVVRDHKTLTLTATLDDEAQRSRARPGARNRAGGTYGRPI